MNNELEITMIDPSDILADKNIRFGLKKYRVEDLAGKISRDGVKTPIEVELLDPPVDGHNYQLTVGHYRHAAVTLLNANGSSIMIPAIVHQNETPADRLMRQVSENNDRENLSPMDKAVAMKEMLDADIPKIQIRQAFATPGGKKGLSMKPASNAHINMTVSFLDFPKDIQNKIHDGRITVGAAYELSRRSRDKWDTILEKAEAEYTATQEQDDKDEEKFLAGMKKAEEAEQKATAAKTELETATKAAEEADKAATEATEAAAQALKATTARGLTKEQKDAANTAFKEAKAAADTANKEAEASKKKLEKLSGVAKSTAEVAKEKLVKARADAEAKKNGKKAPVVGAKDIKKAAAATPGAEKSGGTKLVALNATEMRAAVDTLSKPGGRPKVQKIGEILKACFAGEFPESQLGKKIGAITGEK